MTRLIFLMLLYKLNIKNVDENVAFFINKNCFYFLDHWAFKKSLVMNIFLIISSFINIFSVII